MTTDTDRIKATIRKLLDLAGDDAAMEGEVANALKFARRLMLRHHVSEEDLADLAEAKGPAELAAEAEYTTAEALTRGAKLSQWESQLSWLLTRLVGTVGHYQSGRVRRTTDHGTLEFDAQGKVKRGTRLVFYGPLADARDAAELFQEWSTTIATMARLRYGGCFRGPGRSYAEGFVAGMFRQLALVRRDEDQQAEGSDCTALMIQGAQEIMLAKRNHADVWLKKDQGVRLTSRSASSGGQHHGGAWSSGQADGQRANVSRNQTKQLEG